MMAILPRPQYGMLIYRTRTQKTHLEDIACNLRTWLNSTFLSIGKTGENLELKLEHVNWFS